MTEKRALVTGGCGFIGAWLCKSLALDGWRVAAVDDLSVGRHENLSAEAARSVEIAEIDIRDSAKLDALVSRFDPAAVFHLAAVHFIPACESDPRRAIDVNVTGTQSVLDSCARKPVDAVVIASSGAVYDPSDQPHDEGSRLAPTDVYGHTKLWAEQLGARFHSKASAGLGVARIFNVIGPGETNPHFVPSLLQQALNGNEVRLGNLTTKRDYIHVADVARGLRRLATAAAGGNAAICNLGGGHAYEGHEVVDRVERLIGRPLSIVTDEKRLRASDRPVLASDNSRAERVLGWSPRQGLDEGLRDAMARPVAAGVDVA